MQINDRFTFERDQYGWQVHEWSTGESRKKGHEYTFLATDLQKAINNATNS